jgi:signal transduction histidine kinase
MQSMNADRNIRVADKIARLLGMLSIFLLLLLLVRFGLSVNSPIILALAVFFFSIPSLHKAGYCNVGRILLCIVPVIITILAALLAKIFSTSFTDILYYDSRFVLLLLTIVPCLVFDTREKLPLFSSLAVILLSLVLFDPLHELFGVGYFQRGFNGTSYYFINYFVVACFFGISAGALSQKRTIEETDQQNFMIKEELARKNTELIAALNQLEERHSETLSQNEEILAQQDKLLASRAEILGAHQLIEKQKSALEQQVTHINADLRDVNEELVKQNNVLRQFSYTISHNLRGPIARLIGLAYLAEKSPDDTVTIVPHIRTSASELDRVIRDLNQIIDFQNAINQTRRNVDFAEEWEEVKAILHISKDIEAINFKVDFSVSSVISVKPMINSILYNLVSNCLKYKSPERPLSVILRTYQVDNNAVIEVTDNGLGIDLDLFKGDIFKMYKRFHNHVEGKGLGLYLVKLQAEALNGKAEVESQPGEGTTFRIHIRSELPPELFKYLSGRETDYDQQA